MARPDARLLALAAGVALVFGAAHGDERSLVTDLGEQLSRSVELPSHRWLVKKLRDSDTELAPFTTDGCSGGMSSLWTFTAERFPAFAEAHDGVPPWQECCVVHDHAYYQGGSEDDAEASYDARLVADEALRSCVAATADRRDEDLGELYDLTPDEVNEVYTAIAAAMFHAVRLGGGPCTGLPWRWGYGYPDCWAARD